MWVIILKLLTLFETLLDFFVGVQAKWITAGDGQWTLVYLNAGPTTKGLAVIADVATIIHNMLDFVAQFTTLFPAANNVEISSLTPTWAAGYAPSP
jgi:hypothetical protein